MNADAVRDARRAVRAAGTRLETAEARLREAWLGFDRARDAAGDAGSAVTDRDDLVRSWQTLTEWAAATASERAQVRDATVAVAEAALTALTD